MNSPNHTGFGGTGTVMRGSSLLGGAVSSRVHPRNGSVDNSDRGLPFLGRESSNSRSLDDMSSAESDEDNSGKTHPTLAKHR